MTDSQSERRSRTREELNNLVKDRSDVLAMYCSLAGVNSDNIDSVSEIEYAPEQLQEFCESLIDYIARGQFELYQRIADGKERRQNIIELANKIYPRISETTDFAVEFNDLCEKSANNSDAITEKLPQLGEELAIRFELEDSLISALLAPKSEAAAAS